MTFGPSRSGSETFHRIARGLEIAKQEVRQEFCPPLHEQRLAVTDPLMKWNHVARVFNDLVGLRTDEVVIHQEPVVDPRQHFHFIKRQAKLTCTLERRAHEIQVGAFVIDHRAAELQL